MRTYLADIIPKIKRFSEKLDNLTLLTNQHWVVIDELRNSKYVYIFRSNNQLLVSQNGKVEKGKWEYLGNNSLLIERKEESYLFRHGFFDANILALKVDGKDEFAFLVNENKYEGDLNSVEKVLDFLDRKYLKVIPPEQTELTRYNEYSESKSHTINLNKDLNPVKNEAQKYGYLDREGNIIIPHKYHRAYDFSEGLALVVLISNENDFYGYIDEKGNEVIPLQYEFGENFSEGRALVRQNGKFGFIDRNGDIIIDFNYESADSFANGLAKVKIGDRFFKIDNFGNQI